MSDLGLSGGCEVQLSESSVGQLAIYGQVSAEFKMKDSRIATVHLIPSRDRSRPRSEPNMLALHGKSSMDINDASGLKTSISADVKLDIHSTSRDVQITGPGTVVFHQSAQQLTFHKPAPLIDIKNNAQLVEVAGPVRLGNVAGAGVVGKTVEYDALITDSRRMLLTGLSELDVDTSGLTIDEVVLPVTLTGLQMIAALQANGHQVTPSVHAGLPGLGPLSGARLTAFRHPRTPRSEMVIAAQYARSLADLANSKGAPASVRTKLAWCAYRMRNVVAPGRMERSLLSLYRTIGYGERVLPAAICYAVLAAIMNLISLHDKSVLLTIDGLHHWLRGMLDWLVTPLHILKLTGDKQTTFSFSQPWDTLARLLVAIPFATGILALRKYVKEDRK
jgi:hypothetical protein